MRAARPAGRAAIALGLVGVLAACGAGDIPAARPSTTTTAFPTETPLPTALRTSPATVLPAPPPSEPELPPTDAPVAERELRAELLAMLVEDQAVRTGIAPPGDDRTEEELLAASVSVEHTHSARMTEILDEHGWPGWALVGADGAFAAWVLIQHADLTPGLQRRGLELMTDAVAAGDADPSDLAYLVDRVRVAEGEPQVYGTQWETGPDGELRPRTPIEDDAGVDIRRAEVGLGTLEAYLEEWAAGS